MNGPGSGGSDWSRKTASELLGRDGLAWGPAATATREPAGDEDWFQSIERVIAYLRPG